MTVKGDISRDGIRQSATVIVGALTSKHRTQADFICVGENDHLVIQAALNALPAGGGRVILLDGEFLMGGRILLPSNTTLEGQGRATTIKAAPSIPVPTQMLTIEAGVSGITVKNLKLDGDGKAFSCFNIYTKAADAIATHDIRFERCDIRHGYDRCGLSWSTHPTLTNYDLSFIDCVFGPRKDMAGDPNDPVLDLCQSSDVLIRGCRFIGNKAHLNYPLLLFWSDLDVDNPACERIVVTGNIFRNGGREALSFTGVNGLKVQNNIFYDCVSEAIVGRDVKSLDFDISNNLIWKCGPDASACVCIGESELEFTGKFTGNYVRSPLAGGIIVSGFGRIQVSNNVFRDINPTGKSWDAGGFVLNAEVAGAGLFEFRGNILHEMHVNTAPVLLNAKEATPVARMHFYDNLLNVGTIGVSPKFRGYRHPQLPTQSNNELFEILKDFTASYRCENNKYIENPSPDVLIDNCEDAWNEWVNANVVSTTSTDCKVGTKSAKLEVGVDVGAGEILATEAMAAVDLTSCDTIACWMKSSISTTFGQLQLLLDNSPNCASPLESLNIPSLPVNEWKRIFLPLSSPAALGAIVSVGLKGVDDVGAFTLLIDDVRGISTAESARFPLKSGKASFQAYSLVVDLSGGAINREVFRAKNASILHGYDVVYTEASSADVGATIQVGKYSDGVAPNNSFFNWTASEVSKNKGYIKSFARTDIPPTITQTAIAAGEIVTCGTEGGKVGTGEVMFILYIEAVE